MSAETDTALREELDAIVDAAVRATLDAAAAAFEELARRDVDGESGTVTYRQVISGLRNAGPTV